MPEITPFLWFDDNLEDALAFYATVFEDMTVTEQSRSGPADTDPLFSARFRIHGQDLLAINGGPLFPFTEAISLFVAVDGQAEVDRLWKRLTDGGEPGRCGWLKDRFGLSWQVVPRRLMELLGDPDPGRATRARDAMMAMSKIDISALEAAADDAATG
jgi:predicted 3-demethylubiquinone-9 3-methyltransferase (glyoxalase superfamily)